MSRVEYQLDLSNKALHMPCHFASVKLYQIQFSFHEHEHAKIAKIYDCTVCFC